MDWQRPRQSKRSEGALAESGGGALKSTELLRIKTNLQILYGYQYAQI